MFRDKWFDYRLEKHRDSCVGLGGLQQALSALPHPPCSPSVASLLRELSPCYARIISLLFSSSFG
jgi:hypothetical protein